MQLRYVARGAVWVAGSHPPARGLYLTDLWKRALWIGLTIFWIALLLYVRILKPLIMLQSCSAWPSVVAFGMPSAMMTEDLPGPYGSSSVSQ